MRALIVASVASMIWQFNMDNIRLLIEMGYEVNVITNFQTGSTCSKQVLEELKEELKKLNVTYYDVPIPRKVTAIKEMQVSYKQIKSLLKKNHYDLLHCQSPVGGVLARMAASTTNQFKGKIIYTAHGFHFYKGAPKKNWLIYYNIEKWMARYTDILITINKEDYNIAREKFSLKKGGQVVYVPGVGVDTKKIASIVNSVNRTEKRKKLGLKEDDFVLINAAELSQRKNQKVILKAVVKLREKYEQEVQVLFCGKGSMKQELEDYAEHAGIGKQIKFLGYRTDLYELYAIADCFIFPSLQEGLPVALMEAMAAGLPVVCSRIRGNSDLVKDGHNGYLVAALESNRYAENICKLIQGQRDIGEKNLEIIKDYDIKEVRECMRKRIYAPL